MTEPETEGKGRDFLAGRCRLGIDAPCVFLSAGVPSPPERLSAERRALEVELIGEIHAGRIREAVQDLARALLAAEFGLVFGGHPQITPLVLHIARRVVVRAGGPRVAVFQSRFFERRPARWPTGRGGSSGGRRPLRVGRRASSPCAPR